MTQTLEIIAIQLIAILTFVIALITTNQAHRAWNWPWSLNIPEGANGRWKLDWSIAFFLWGVGINYQIDVVNFDNRPKDSFVIFLFHILMMILTVWVFRLMRHEYHQRRKEGNYE